MQEEIIKAIAAHLEKKAIRKHLMDNTDIVVKQLYKRKVDFSVFKEIASELYAAIAQHLGAVEPDWSDAPEWAEWRTIDVDGIVMFWEHKPAPLLHHGEWYTKSGRRCILEERQRFDWKDSLQQRPQ